VLGLTSREDPFGTRRFRVCSATRPRVVAAAQAMCDCEKSFVATLKESDLIDAEY